MARKGKPKPSVHKFSRKKDDGEKARDAREAKREAARKHEAEERIERQKAEVRISSKKEPKGLVGRLAAAMDKGAARSRGSDDDEVEVRAHPKGNPKGGVSWDDLDDLDLDDEPAAKGGKQAARGEPAEKGHGKGRHDEDEEPTGHTTHGPARKGTAVVVDDDPADTPVVVKPAKVAPVEDGVSVVAPESNKFSLADIEALKAAIKIKGGTQVIEGINLDELKWDAEGLVPVVAQDRRTGAVVMLGWMNREGVESSLRSKAMTYWNRAHAKPQPMDEAGRHQRLVQMKVDCDKDALLAVVDQEGPACHNNGTGTCWTEDRGLMLAGYLGILDHKVRDTAKDASVDPKTAKLMAEPIQALKAFVDDANHLTKTLQGKTNDSADAAAANLLFHMMVVLRVQGVSLEKVVTELYGRHLGEQLTKAHK